MCNTSSLHCQLCFWKRKGTSLHLGLKNSVSKWDQYKQSHTVPTMAAQIISQLLLSTKLRILFGKQTLKQHLYLLCTASALPTELKSEMSSRAFPPWQLQPGQLLTAYTRIYSLQDSSPRGTEEILSSSFIPTKVWSWHSLASCSRAWLSTAGFQSCFCPVARESHVSTATCAAHYH